jgi:predicted methyltransferase
MDIEAVVLEPADYVFLANTFHGVPAKAGLARAVAAILKPPSRFGIVNWHRRPGEETVVLNQPRGPRTEMRMEPDEVAATVEPVGLRLAQIVELPPYHYGVIFEKPTT